MFVSSVSPKPSEFPQIITCLCQGTVLLLLVEKSAIFNSNIPFFTTFFAQFYGRNCDSFSRAFVDLFGLILNIVLH